MKYNVSYFAFVNKAYLEPMRKIGLFVTENDKVPQVCLVEAKLGLDVLRAQLISIAHEIDDELFMIEKDWKVPAVDQSETDLHNMVWRMAVEDDKEKFLPALQDAINMSQAVATKNARLKKYN